MATQYTARDQQIWAQIEGEKRIDRRLRRVSISAWTFTIIFTLLFAVVIGLQAARVTVQFSRGVSPHDVATVAQSAMLADAFLPLVIVLGLLSTLIAVLATIGIFLRLRTASLQEIQLRLAALEEMLTRDDSRQDATRR